MNIQQNVPRFQFPLGDSYCKDPLLIDAGVPMARIIVFAKAFGADFCPALCRIERDNIRPCTCVYRSLDAQLCFKQSNLDVSGHCNVM